MRFPGIPAPFPGPPIPMGFPSVKTEEEEEEMEENSSLSEVDRKFMELPTEAKEQALNYIGNWRHQEVDEAVERWKIGLQELGVTPGPITTESYRRQTLRKIGNRKERR